MPTLDDIEMASAALLSTVTPSHRGSQLTAIRMLRDECGWTLLRAKVATDHVHPSRGTAPDSPHDPFPIDLHPSREAAADSPPDSFPIELK